MSRQPLLVFGAGRLGRQLLHHLRQLVDVRIEGFVDDVLTPGSEAPGGHRCLGSLEQVVAVHGLGPAVATMVFAVGYADMAARGRALQRVLDAGYRLHGFVHPRACVEPGSQVGDGSIVLAGAIVDQNVSLGPACYIDIGVRIGEDCVVGHNNYFSSGAALGGSVRVGHGNFFGMDSTAVTGVSIGSNCFINAKTLVVRDLPDDTKLVQLHKTKELPLARLHV